MMKKSEEIAKLILVRPKLTHDVRCPKCQKRYISGTYKVKTNCKDCGSFEHDLKLNIYQHFAHLIVQKLANYNELHISTPNTTEHLKDMVAISTHWKTIPSFIIDGPDLIYDNSIKKICLVCGVCEDCVKCKKCEAVITKDHSERCKKKGCHGELKRTLYNRTECNKCGQIKKLVCPSCGEKDFIKYHIPKLEKNEFNRPVCPMCNGLNITRSEFTSSKCPNCKSKKFIDRSRIYKLIIKRKKAHRLENL